MVSELSSLSDRNPMANLTAEQYDTLQEMLKVITEARQISERLSESWAKGLANPIGPRTTHLSSPIAPMTPSQSPQPPDPPDLLLVDPEAAKMVDTRTQSLIDVNKQLAETHTTQLEQLQKHNEESAAWRAEIDERFMDIKNVRADPLPRESSVTLISYPTPTKPPDPPDIRKSRQDLTIKAPDPPDFNQSELISVIQISNKLSLRYSCEEIHERMTNGLCIFCEELDTPEHYNLKHKRSKICLVECVGDGLPDVELVEPAVEEISKKSQIFMVKCDSNESFDVEKPGEVIVEEIANKPVDMIQEKESNPENDSRPEFSHQVLLSQVQHTPTNQYRAPFNPCQNHSDKPHNKSKFGNYTGHEIEFDRQCEEIEDDELKDKQPEEDVETWIMSENTQFLECVDDEFYVDENLIKVIAEETAIELVDESGYKVFKERNLNSLLFQEFQIVLLHLNGSSDTIVPCRNLDTRVLSFHFFAGGTTLLSKMVCAFLLPFLTMNIDSRTIRLNSRSTFVDDDDVALRRILEDRFVLRMEEICLESMKQNLEFAIDRGWVEFWTNTYDFTLTNYGLRLSPSEYTKNAFILVYHLCKHSSFCLFLNTSTGCIGALLMVYDAKRLIQLDAPPVFNDLLCVMNRIRVRLKMVLLLEFLWLTLITSKMFKSSNVPQNKNQRNQKLNSYWNLLLRLLHPFHTNRWGSFCLLVIKSLFGGKEEVVSYNIAVISCSSCVKVLELIKDKASRKRKLGKNWWFKYKLNTWFSEALHFWMKRKYEKMQRTSENMVCELIYKIRKACHCVVHETNLPASHVWYGWKTKIMQTFSPMIEDTHWDKETWVKLNPESCKGGSLLEFLKRHEARFDMIKVPNNTKFFNSLKFLVKSYILRMEDSLKG